MYMINKGEMVYFVEGVVVMYNVEEKYKRKYIGKNDDVKWINVKKKKIIVEKGKDDGNERREGR